MKAANERYEAKEFTNVYVTNHAYKRWKQRVGKLNKSGISLFIKGCADKGMIEHYWDKFYIVDNDIVIRVDAQLNAEGAINQMSLVTVFGRISETPALNNIQIIVKEKKKYGKMLKGR